MAPDPDVSAQPADLARDLRVVVGQLRRALREHGHTQGVTSSEIVALGHIERGGLTTVTALARAEGVRPQSMGATIASLQAAGLVVASPDANDGRQSLLSLTPQCRAWLQESRAAREDWLHRSLDARLTPQEQQALAHAVTLLQRLVVP
jgi:DNA-binding MarR family transcriptional regulator